MSLFSGTVYTLAGSILIFAAWPKHEVASQSTRPAWVVTAPDPELQSKRSALIQEAINRGIFSKVTDAPGKYTHVWVTRTFKALNFDDKALFINVVHARKTTEDPGHDLIFLNDNMTGKVIGKYSSFSGLDLD